MGFVVATHGSPADGAADGPERKDQAVVYGKAAYMWKVKHCTKYDTLLVFHSTLRTKCPKVQCQKTNRFIHKLFIKDASQDSLKKCHSNQ